MSQSKASEARRPRMGNPNTFHFVMIAPSHYDDEGYVIQWKVSSIPSNSMASIYGIAQDAIERRPLGPDVEIRLEAFQEANTRIVPEEIAARLQGPDSRIFVALVGVQSNQFPRAVDLARRFLACGVKVCIGGFHVSGCVSMLDDAPPEIAAALGRWHQPLRRRDRGTHRIPVAGRLEGPTETPLQLHGRLAGTGRTAGSLVAPRGHRAKCRTAGHFRCRTRLPVQVLLLHDHQRPGPEIPLSRRRRCGEDHPPQPGPGHLQLLHQRRQLRAQQDVGAHLRSADPPPGGGGSPRSTW